MANEDRRQGGTMNEGEILHGPRLRHAAIITVIGYVMGWGVPFASFYVIPKLFAADNAAKTSQNIVANQGLFVAAIFAFLISFIGDVVAAWGLYLLLRPVMRRSPCSLRGCGSSLRRSGSQPFSIS